MGGFIGAFGVASKAEKKKAEQHQGKDRGGFHGAFLSRMEEKLYFLRLALSVLFFQQKTFRDCG
jgi:hypothetical protein